jgi:hypothetical protein
MFLSTSVGSLYIEGVGRLSRIEGSAVLNTHQVPLMVRLPDQNSTAGATVVDPANLAATFGDEVVLQKVTITTTRDPVTRHIDQFPFMEAQREAAKVMHIQRKGDPFRLTAGMLERDF